MRDAAEASGLPTGIDFNFHQIMAWQKAKAMLDGSAIGPLRHVTVHWHVENYSIQNRMRNWKTLRDDGGGVAGLSMSDYARSLVRLCEDLPERPVLLGHSMVDPGAIATTIPVCSPMVATAGLPDAHSTTMLVRRLCASYASASRERRASPGRFGSDFFNSASSSAAT